jgi:hypothetical protein
MQPYPAFRSNPTSGQFAKNGAWEQAWSFDRTAVPDDAGVVSYLANTSEVAFEAFFGDAFFGIRFAGLPLAIEAFALNCVRAFREEGGGDSFFSALRENLGVEIFGSKVAFAEVGSVNAWRSVGAFRIEKPQYALANLEEVLTSLASSSVAQDPSHRKAIEFAFKEPIPHWLGIPVSDSEAPYKISFVLLSQALQLIEEPMFSEAESNKRNV